MAGKVLHLFGRGEPEPEPEPEPRPRSDFDFEGELLHLSGYMDDISTASGPAEVKRLIAQMVEETKDWPDG